MAIIKKFKPNQVFITKRLKNRLQALFEYSVSVIEAPEGFGKTTVMKEFISNSNRDYIWFHIHNNNKTHFKNDLSNKIDQHNFKLGKAIRDMEYPSDLESASKLADTIIRYKSDREVIWIFDNYHYIADDISNKIIMDVTRNPRTKIKIILLTQKFEWDYAEYKLINNHVNHIGLNDLQLTKEEMIEYGKCCGVKLFSEEVDYLYLLTAGWVNAIYIQFLHYVKEHQFDPRKITDRLIMQLQWNQFDKKTQSLLILCSMFDGFSRNQVHFLFENEFLEEEILALFKQIDFIHYDSGDSKHYFHATFKYFLQSQLDNLEIAYKKKIFDKIGDWYCLNDNYYLAVKYYYKISNYEKILAIPCKPHQILNYISHEDKEIFLDIVYDTSIEEIQKNTLNYLIYIYSLLLFNERNLLKNKYNQLIKLINENETITAMQKETLLGYLEFIFSLSNFNDLQVMCESYKKALKLLKGPGNFYFHTNPLTDAILFHNPLILAQYHKNTGDLERELQLMNRCMPYYYQLTNGSAKGTEALMHAQALFYQGDYASAKVLLEKSIYMANTRNQKVIVLNALFLLARIYMFESNLTGYKENMQNMKTIANCEDSNLRIVFELSSGFLSLLLEEEAIVDWLKKSEDIEKKNCTMSLGFANVIYGKYLLMKEEYTKLLGISGQLLNVANLYSQIIYQIYTYIYIATANFKINSHEKALKFLVEALNLAICDKLYIPFVENYTAIEPLLSELENDQKFQQFILCIGKLSKVFMKGKHLIHKYTRSNKNYGLTNRELDVALLASQRMSNKEIAETLFIAESTVKSNLKIVFNKLGVNSRANLKDYLT